MLTGKKLITRSVKEASLLRPVVHPYRIAILHLLSESDMRLKELAIHTQLPASLVAHHVGQLHHAGLVGKYQIGARRFYRLDKKNLEEANKILSL